MLNFSWLLGHLHQGHKFYIVSGIPENEFRRTRGAQRERSAFALEMCTAHKAEYHLTYDQEKGWFCLTPSKSFNPGRCISSGEPGDGINPSDKEAQGIFAYFKQKIESLNAERNNPTPGNSSIPTGETETTLIKYSKYGRIRFGT